MKKNKKKMKSSISLSLLFTILLIGTSLLNPISTNALLNTNENQFTIDSFDRFAWKWSITEVVTSENMDPFGHPSLAVDSAGNVHATWTGYSDYGGSDSDADIFYKRWDESTQSWTITEVVSTESTDESTFSSIAVDSSGNVHIAWWDITDYAGSGTDDDIFYKCWNASTSLWTTTEVVTTGSTTHSRYCYIATDLAGNVHVAWDDNADYAGSGIDKDIFYKRKDASTSTWSTTEVVSTESTDSSDSNSLVVDSSGDVHIAWADLTDYAGAGSDWDIFYKRWDSSSSLWTTTEVVSNSTDSSKFPSLAVDLAGNIHIAWRDSYLPIDWTIFYKRWDTFSNSWTTPEAVSTESTENSDVPSLAVDSFGNVHVAWHDETNYTVSGTDIDVLYKRWDASSTAWTTTGIVSTESTAASSECSLVVDSTGTVHIAWHDETDYVGSGSNFNVFYKRFTGPPATPNLAFLVPNPTELSTVFLDWNDVIGASTYHVYRSSSYIWSVEGLVPITSITADEYIDAIPAEGFYYYAIIAENFVGKSAISNCQYIEYELPTLDEFILISSLIIGLPLFLFVATQFRKKKSKLN